MVELDIKWVYRHDLWNIFTLPIVVFVNWYYLVYPSEYSRSVQYYGFLIYIGLDTLWVLIVPKCVGSPKMILGHHLVTMAGWNLQIILPEMSKYFAMALLVEANTWLKISKRYFSSAPLIIRQIVDALFYLSWYLFRVVMYPYLVYALGTSWLENSIDSYINSYLGILIVTIILTIMNMKWTYDLCIKGGYLGVKVINKDGKISALDANSNPNPNSNPNSNSKSKSRSRKDATINNNDHNEVAAMKSQFL